MLWKAHLFHNKVRDKSPHPVLFPLVQKNFQLPDFIDSHLELAFEQMELLGFPLCNPFDLIEETTSTGVLAKDIPHYLHQKVVCFGYLIALKQSKTVKNELMYFGNYIDQSGQVFDTVHFPEVARKFPYKGKGIYKIKGTITEEFGHFALQAEVLLKISYMEDARYA
jgi:DNA polymerase-3 subunit alpha